MAMTITDRIELGVLPSGKTFVRVHFDDGSGLALLGIPPVGQVELLRRVVREACCEALRGVEMFRKNDG